MVKIIASDLDGTLLQGSNQTLSDEIFDIIHELNRRGILFVAASGRQYPNLKLLFEPVAHEMAFISSNGALGMYQGKELFHTPIERKIGKKIIEDIRSKESLEVLVDGKMTSYIQPKSDAYRAFLTETVKNHMTIVEDIVELPEDYLKISIYEKNGVASGYGNYYMDNYGTYTSCAISGNQWMDFTDLSANKGTAIRKLMEKLCIVREDSMAFGDNFNDIQMLEYVKYGYVMETAHEDVKKVCRRQCRRVEDTLKELLDTQLLGGKNYFYK